MRFGVLLFTLFVLGFSQAQMSFAADREPISVQWYEPKVRPTNVPGLTYVLLVGFTEPGVTAQVTAKNIIVIQPADPKDKVLPRIGEPLVQSDAKGFFRLRLFMPNGLSQVPIVLKNQRGVQHTILLTMRVDPQDVSLNVKVIRPTKTKIVTVVEKPPVEYSLMSALAPMMFRETLSPDGKGDLSLPLDAYQALRLEAAIKSTKWWWQFHYEFANVSAPSTLDGRSVSGGSANLQATRLGGKYRLTGSENELWLGLDVDARFFPLLAVSNVNEVSLIEARLFRVGLGLTYLLSKDNWDYAGGIAYREPVAIKVNNGEVAYQSRYALALQAEMNYHWNENWTFGTAAEMEFSSFTYEYNNSPSLIANKGTGSQNLFQILAQARYTFGDKKKETDKN